MKPLCRRLIFLLLLGSIFQANQALGEGEDQTILLDESLIKGSTLLDGQSLGRRRLRREGPVLSTSFRWDGESVDKLDIPKEILNELTQPGLPFTLRDAAEPDETVESLDEQD